MSQEDYTAKILGMEDMEIEKVDVGEEIVRIRFHKRRQMCTCPNCGRQTGSVHDYHIVNLRDIPIQGRTTRLEYRRRRYVCRECGKRFPEPFTLAGRHQRTTGRLVLLGLDLARERRSGKSIANELGVSPSSVNRWFRYLPSSRPTLLPEVLSIDEFKGDAGGERFQCILTDPAHHRVFDILPDRTAATIQTYLRRFPNRNEVRYFVMDMNQAYRDIALTFFPKAKLVVDRFHFVRYAVWAFEDVRRRVQKSLSAQKRRYFKRSRKLLLARASRLSVEDRQAVEVMLACSEDLTRAWLLKEEFFRFVDAPSSDAARKALEHFRFCANGLKLPEFKPCLRILRNWEEYILNSFDCPYSNGFTEGTNNATKALKRVTFGMPNFSNARARILHCSSAYPYG